MEYKVSPQYTKQIEGRTVTGIVSVFGIVDSGNDIVHSGAFRKTMREHAKRQRHLWQHHGSLPAIAVPLEAKEIGRSDLPEETRTDFPDATGGLLYTREYLETQRGNEILTGLKAGVNYEMSFGYEVIKSDFDEHPDMEGVQVRNLREVRVWDWSDVNWGMNPATVAVKAAVSFRDTGTADEDADWSAPKLSSFTDELWDDLEADEKNRIAAHFAWQPSGGAESFAELKLPHHRASTSGVGPAIWRGVSAAMAALLGARGGVDIPDDDRRGVYNHLVKHYDQYDKDPPDFKLVQLAYSVRAAKALVAGGRLTEPLDPEAFKERLVEVEQLLMAAEPLPEAGALTAGKLFAEFQATNARLMGVPIEQGAK